MDDPIRLRAGGNDDEEDERLEVNGQVFYYPAQKAELKELVIKLLTNLMDREAMTPYAMSFISPLFRCLLEASEIKVAAVVCIPLIAKRLNNNETLSKEFFKLIFTEFGSGLENEDAIENIDVIAVCWKETIENCIMNTHGMAPVFEPAILRRMVNVICSKVSRCLETWSPNDGILNSYDVNLTCRI